MTNGGYEAFCRELLSMAYPEMDAYWLDEQTANLTVVAADAAAAAERAASQDQREIRAAVQEALGTLRDAAPSPERSSATTRAGDIELTVTARPDGSRYDITLQVTSRRLPVDELVGTWLTASATSSHAALLPVRHIAPFDEQGRADFANVRAGHWSFETLTPTWDDDFATFPMPAMEARAVAATTGQYAVAAPNRALFILSIERNTSPALEVTAPVNGPQFVPVRYLDRQGTARRLFMAIAPALTGQARSRMALADFAPGTPWETGDYQEAGVLTPADGAIVAESIRATHHRPTRRAWRVLASEAHPEIASIIEALLAER